MQARLKLTLNILFFTAIIGLAVSYISQIAQPYVPKVNFLEAIGLYCLFTPIHHFFLGISRENDKDEE